MRFACGFGRFGISAGLEEAVKDVVFVGCDQEFADRQTEAKGVVAGQYVTKIACWDNKFDSSKIRTRAEELVVCAEVIRDLGEDAGPVDAVDGTEVVSFVDQRVSKESFDVVLAVIESPYDGKAVHVGVGDCGHLELLDRADFAMGKHDED